MKLEVGMKVQRVKGLDGWWSDACVELGKELDGLYLITGVFFTGIQLEGWPEDRRKPSRDPYLYEVMSVATKEDCL